MKFKPSLNPQNINIDTWYYEYKSSINLVHWSPDKNYCVTIKIPKKMLKESLKRMG